MFFSHSYLRKWYFVSILSLPSTRNWQIVSWLKCRLFFCESLWRWNIRWHITVHMVVGSLNVSELWGTFVIKCHMSQQRVGGHEIRHLCYHQEKLEVLGSFPDFIQDIHKMSQLFMCLLRISACRGATLKNWTWYYLVNIWCKLFLSVHVSMQTFACSSN